MRLAQSDIAGLGYESKRCEGKAALGSRHRPVQGRF
jgi:hypothetical protein